MATQVQRRKGTTAQHSTFTGAIAELTVDTTKNTVVVHDGVTAGGTPLAKESGSDLSPSSLTLSGGTANGVAYLNGSKVLTTGSALTFNGTNLGVGITSPSASVHTVGNIFVGLNSSSTARVAVGTGGYDTLGSTVPMVLSVGGTEQMRLTSTGLGIGTSSPAAGVRLQVSGGKVRIDHNTALEWGGTAYSIVGNATTGFLQFNTASTERLRIDSSGNLGLGVTPSNASATTRTFEIGSSTTRTGNGLVQAPAASYIQLSSNTKYDASANPLYASTVPAASYHQYNGDHVWLTAPSGTAGNAISFTQAMTLTAAGRLGIGTTSPAALLDVSGGNNSNGSITVSATGATAGTFASMNFTTGTGTWSLGQEGNGRFFVYDGSADRISFSAGGANSSTSLSARGTGAFIVNTNNTERLRIDSSGNVGIGTSSPTSSLELGSGVFRLKTLGYDGTDTRKISWYSVGANPYENASISVIRSGSFGNASLVFSTKSGTTNGYDSATERLRIDSSGNLGLGVTPSAWVASNYVAMQVGRSGSFSARASVNQVNVTDNAANIAGTGWTYLTTAAASTYQQSSGVHVWLTAPSGTAGNAITFTDRARISATEMVVNEPGEDYDFRVESDTNTHALFVDAGNSRVGVNNSAPAVALDVTGQIRASTGILFGTDTAAANALDDYEEGTFTPTIVGSTTAGTATYTTQLGRYTKIGDLVYFSLTLVYSGGTGTGNLQINGLPFTTLNTSGLNPVFSIVAVNLTFTGQVYANSANNSTVISLAGMNSVGAATVVAYDAAANLYVSGCYKV